MSYKRTKSDLRIENEVYIRKLADSKVLSYIDITDSSLFKEYAKNNYFADTTFQMLYGWSGSCHFCISSVEGGICCMGIGVDDNLSCGIIAKDSPGIKNCVDRIRSILSGRSEIIIDNIPEEQLCAIRECLDSDGVEYCIESDEDFADYLYTIDNYISLDGKQNKTKRGNMNRLLREYPDIRYEEYTGDKIQDVLEVFRGWCSCYDCSKCVFGCEYDALQRMMEVYDDKNVCSIVYIGEEPVAFSLCAVISDDVIACLIQKTKYPIRGLAYYASYCIKDRYQGSRYIDLCEDMGIEGLRMDKKSLHPDLMVNKYRVIVK